MNRKLFWVTSILGAGVMSLVMSGLISTINNGLDHMTFMGWMRSFIISWPIAFTMNILVLPSVRSLAVMVCPEKAI
ncbi:DUF2798 domain-containing protein [Parendozoicomonas sp. Alg238-R29]|uniref:DUF2798 domain-containing protein n=1 Tax=Parendozoicomonas sp. Alg238-R29 TaxID=2993446 RepID=UPI00248E3CE4|nr:DUF2798 domain-containing protein [Parendozoicomonas sp. Alg238-R29]